MHHGDSLLGGMVAMVCVPALGQGGGCAGRGHTPCVVAAGPTGVEEYWCGNSAIQLGAPLLWVAILANFRYVIMHLAGRSLVNLKTSFKFDFLGEIF